MPSEDEMESENPGAEITYSGGIGAKLKLFTQLGPGVFWMVLFFFIPILVIFTYSFYHYADGLMERAFTVENYVRAFTQQVYFRIFIKSLRYGVFVTLACLLIAYPCAYFLARTRYKRKEVLFLALIVPFWTSIVVRTYAWKILLGTNGLVNFFLTQTGFIEDPISFLYSERAVFIGLTHVFLPFMILPLYASIEKINLSLEEAAEDLGANRLKTFLHVTMPLSLPGISTGCLIVFILTVGSYITPDLLGGPSELMISNIIQKEYYVSFNWPFGSALAMLLLFIILVLILFYNRLFKLEKIAGG
jgi:spermidine/putrescine transport system permease protein